jgi:hypothetical protein
MPPLGLKFATSSFMDFQQVCQEASTTLLGLSTQIDAMEIQLVKLNDTRTDTTLLTGIVTGLLEAKDLSENLQHTLIPAIALEDPAVALAMRIAYQEVMRRYWGVRDDFEIMTKVNRPLKKASRPPAPVVNLNSRRVASR